MYAAEENVSAKVLAVDDEPFDLLMIERYLSRAGFQVVRANGGAQALRILAKSGSDLPEAILLDRMMPEMSGIEFMELLNADPVLRDIPVIMQTGLDDPSQIAFGISRGARYYLAKPLAGELLVSMVRAAVSDYRKQCSLRNSTSEFTQSRPLLRGAQYELSTPQEVKMLSPYLSQYYPQPARVVPGIVEMLVNAVEHGNLGLKYEDKSALLRSAGWEAEIIRRLALPEYRERRVRVDWQRRPDRIVLNITDEGGGFDWHPYLEIQPGRVFDLHGRGIAISRMTSFDEVEYRGRGNEVELTVQCGADCAAGEERPPETAETPVTKAA
jgi:CheY-like chemotaxis protein